jgi:serine protease Do
VLIGASVVAATAIAVGLVLTLTDTLGGGDDATPGATGIEVLSSDRVPTDMVLVAGASIVTVQVARPDGMAKASGVCIADGLVLTSASAIDGATDVRVVTSDDDRRLVADSKGTDPQTDLALLEVDSLDAPPARLGSSAGLREGEWVLGLAAGPRAQQHWVNVGSVRNFNALFVTAAGTVLSGLIDTETGAGRQHAGGVVLDRYGSVVGILTVPAGAAPSGLAVPIDLARDVVGQLATKGKVTHTWLGVSGVDELDRTAGGVRIAKVAPSSPADRAGVLPGDVVISLADGRARTHVSGVDDLLTEIRTRQPGTALELTVLRDGGKLHLPVELAEPSAADAYDTVATTTPPTSAAPPPPDDLMPDAPAATMGP